MKARFLSQASIIHSPTRSALVTSAALCAVTTSALAANQTWDGEVDGNWATANNWVSNVPPGITAPANNNVGQGDVVTFDAASPNTTVTADDTRFVNSIVFAGAAPSYNVAGNLLYLRTGGSISMTPEVTAPQQISAIIRVRQSSSSNGAYSFTNNSSTPAATLSITNPVFTLTNANGRPTTLTLGGSHAGENIISSAITNASGGQAVNMINKTGAGTWVLSGANNFSGTGATNGANGIQITEGVLAITNNAALGTSGTVNAIQTTVSGAGTLEIRDGLAVDNGVSLNLNNGGTIRSAGTTSTLGRINVGAAAGTSATISTVFAGNVFTIGNAANEFTGGAADSVVHVTGPGTVFLPYANNYTGGWSVDGGTLDLGSPTALGSSGSLHVGAGAKVRTLGYNVTLSHLSGDGSISNDIEGPSTITANIATSSTFGGQLHDGAAGILAFTKTGAGILTLAGANTYTDVTTISTGGLNLTGSLGNTLVSGGSGATLSGTGSIGGSVSTSAGFHIAPGDGGNGSVGTLSTGSLALGSDSQLDYDITSTAALDRINVTNSGGLWIGGGQLNINGGSAPFTTNGVYNLISYSGSVAGSGVGALSVNGLNKSVTKTYTFGTSGGFVTLTVANSGAVQNFWNANANANWNAAGSWSPGAAPNATGAFAGFGGGGTEITADRTITVNGAYTVGTLAFNGAANGRSYTLAAGSGARITLNNGTTGAFVTSTSGSHAIDSPVTITNNGATFTITNPADTLTVNGVIDGSATALTKGGAGTLALNGGNTYYADTIINGGTLAINNSSSLGDPAFITILNAGTLRTTADIVSTRTFQVGDLASTISVAPGTTYTIDGQITDAANVGVLNKADSGTLVLTNSNSYTGGTVVNAGTVQVNNAYSLGDFSSPLTLNGGTLQATASFNGNRIITLGNANSAISVDAGVTYVANGAVGGSGALHKTGSGTLTLGSNANTYSGGTVISTGTLAINNASYLPAGTLTFQGGTLQNNYGNNNSYYFNNPISVPAGQTGTINMNNRMSLGGGAAVSGSGTLNVNVNTTATRDDFSNNWAGFAGQLNIAGSGTVRLLNNGGTFNAASFANTSVDLVGSVLLEPSNNTNGNTYTFGALSGNSATAGIKGPSQGGASTLSIGALNTSTTFAGQTLVGHLTKTGSGALSLTGTSPTGNVVVSAGTLSLAVNNLGDASTVTVANGATLHLAFSGTDRVAAVNFDTLIGDGIYGAIGSGAEYETACITGPGFIQVGGDPFTGWIGGFAVGGLTGKANDPDGDGLKNIEEFALDGNPASGAASGKVRSRIEMVGAEQALVITLPVRNGADFQGAASKTAIVDGIEYKIEGSNNLSLFDQGVTEIPVSAAGMPTPLSAGWTYRTFRLDGAIGGSTPRGSKGFLRAVVKGVTP
ncbi:autotransporter-associated beta strand repeat-containing protein [Luteolibacter flavescens]|uniref:Autotransporter-associated beta strand repeat-containing protein n=1 Tax=Luteolibacter flavescens TaxID=1859460 RepID=A0ABT3FS29_9BACT|nr:autotransporter-associated beta strand repeat-containing protein [Luteolibacter flavescens]MCW1886383.1 autotransporter-associated beta strand repeat-containing protein [Luteolibacter flavescens]